ncbi:hypothetical protein [Rhizobium sp. SSA_523]|uniref:hypothetical protein n=1 Tax=Rhizobium sp. SSA_523 TaxID=2952477 RepID=UPI0020913A65|nr:hypothetical protein [Rhizobium sp. SSA_523]MCO5733291.1 hypothetical protein [Rhizobium sp. SSA_523]WKC21726.1 hypothetical protein QTJ18_07615 [Rhizobium sp. SSA_523]
MTGKLPELVEGHAPFTLQQTFGEAVESYETLATRCLGAARNAWGRGISDLGGLRGSSGV